ncbi:hypothetical protein [Anaerotalea alkaliphila]|uniref:Uncharacterized protein n=1 Tax=Anaerotalea alkaliphila TaxID=2662126 RepID=A0A7X5HVQ4_9FIRM|nr:hypothetical protein [Anaerotalea alkaliphila]NDL67537.1 hypothetical protein [Anaerotalea alkaliphila]
MTDKTLKLYSIIIAVIVVLTAACNMIYASIQVIPEPLFTAINDEIVYSETYDETLTISYITNNSDTRRLESLSFDGLETVQLVSQTGYFDGGGFSNDTNDNPFNDIVGRYYTLKSGYIELHLTEADIDRLKEKGSVTLGTGTAMMSDGTALPVSLGRITIHTMEHWDECRLREGGGGSNDHFTVDFKTEKPILMTSLDLSTFEQHQDALDMELTVDSDEVYTYDELINRTEPILINRNFQMACTAVDPDLASQWRFNMISMEMTYEKNGESYDSWIYYPFYGTGMDETSVEEYVEFWRTQNEQ